MAMWPGGGGAVGSADIKNIFREADPRSVTPQSALLDRILSVLMHDTQVKHISDLLLSKEALCRSDDRWGIPLINALEKVYGDDAVSSYRSRLMELFNSIIAITGNYAHESRAVAYLKLAMLGKIIKGWEPTSIEEEESQSPKYHSALCFEFVCHAYSMDYHVPMPEADKFKKGILDLIRQSLGWGKWQVQDLDECIMRVYTPDEIVEVLLHARIRIGGVVNVREMVRRAHEISRSNAPA